MDKKSRGSVSISAGLDLSVQVVLPCYGFRHVLCGVDLVSP